MYSVWGGVGGEAAVTVLTSQRRLEVDLGLAVQVLHARRSAAGQEHVLLLVPGGRVVDRPLALLIQVRHRYTHTGGIRGWHEYSAEIHNGRAMLAYFMGTFTSCTAHFNVSREWTCVGHE